MASSSSSLPAISEASITIGFISFAFTFFTFLRVFWSSILTMWAAPREIRGYLNNLRSELYDERDYFRTAMRDVRSKSRSNPRQRVDCAPVRLMNDSVKSLLQRFRHLEAPFVERRFWDEEADMEKGVGGEGGGEERGGPGDGALGAEPTYRGRGRGGGGGRHQHNHHRHSRIHSDTGNGSDVGVYAPMTFARRWDWLRSKDDVVTLADQVTRIQTRRIAFDTNNVLQTLHAMERQLRELDDRLYTLEEEVLGERLSDGEVYVKRRKSDR